ncbi:serpentine type 7TM GPCR chemoreceptor srt domain-containing protein [Ditylenchus destructor]|uniref:Serpentine type 7TM GPCR chemoreceptor srt domain-containing protein n=1 Tax=Ditylenchus destructor TaxID=166010 RepID=A0AAD4RCE4_9BILA|nr:serpentine type 7TM GPCR chemoreceptor srt domain-containing protein [Ditylenchus destructor]
MYCRARTYFRLYNCSIYNIDDVPIDKRQHHLMGMLFVVFSIIFTALYIPCVIAVSRHMKDSSCYKLLFCIGVIDILNLPLVGFLTGYFAISGVVFCSCPTFLYFAGIYGNFFWVAESSTAIILAANRCIEVISHHTAEILFKDNRTWKWMILTLTYAFCFVTFSKPIMFNGIFMAWFSNPHVGYIDDPNGETYGNFLHTFHNTTVAVALSGLYLLFTIIFAVRTMLFAKTAFIQVLFISFVNAFGACIYDYMQFVRISETLIMIGQCCWLIAHGIPSVFFLFLNKTVRVECRMMLQRSFNLYAMPTSQIGPISHKQSSRTAENNF